MLVPIHIVLSSRVMFTCPALDRQFLSKFGPKYQNYFFKMMKFGKKIIFKYAEIDGDVHFFYLGPNITSTARFGVKIKVAYLRLNVTSRLI